MASHHALHVTDPLITVCINWAKMSVDLKYPLSVVQSNQFPIFMLVRPEVCYTAIGVKGLLNF
jgi:hypothetical protein